MLFHSTVLSTTAMQSDMRANSASIEEHLDYVLRYANINFALDVFVWNRIVLLINSDVVIERNGSCLPDLQLVGISWQGKQKCSLLRKPCCSAAVLLLKRLVIEGTEFFADYSIQFSQSEKSLVSYRGQDKR